MRTTLAVATLPLIFLSLAPAIATAAPSPPASRLEKVNVLPLALDDRYQFRKVQEFLNEPKFNKPTVDPMVVFERQRINYGAVTGIECVRVDEKMKTIEGSEFTLKADLVLLAMGFVAPVKDGMLAELGVKLDGRGNVAADVKSYASSVGKVFACGDMRRGQSLVVWAIREGRQCAASIDQTLMGATILPR